ncbi:hypothetical protein CGOTT_08545 [Corynebacterium gottingense]|nr:hypothetical protein CGOTT_08545 [Corynebacterium gottingense]
MLPGAVLIPALRRLDTAAFQVVGTCTAEPGRPHSPGCIHQSCEQPTEAVPFRMEKTPMRIRWPLCCNRLSDSDIRNCPQRFSKSSVAEIARAPGSPECPTTTVVGLVSRRRSPAVPSTRSTGTNYAESRIDNSFIIKPSNLGRGRELLCLQHFMNFLHGGMRASHRRCDLANGPAFEHKVHHRPVVSHNRTEASWV